jgi:hypothetical protein
LKVDQGHYKNTKLDNAKIRIATDLGSDSEHRKRFLGGPELRSERHARAEDV